MGNRMTNKIVKQKPLLDVNSRHFEGMIIPPEKSEEILNEIKTSIINMEHYKISSY